MGEEVDVTGLAVAADVVQRFLGHTEQRHLLLGREAARLPVPFKAHGDLAFGVEVAGQHLQRGQ